MAALTTPTYTVRFATEHDIPSILGMIRELADYEKSLSSVQATEAKLFDTLSFPTSSDPKVRAKAGFAKTLLISPPKSNAASGDEEERIAGMALFFNNYSTWTAAPGIYLEDLFVRPEYRGKGYGKALLQALARECRATGCQRLDWSVLKWNTPSIEFYESGAVGAERMEEWVGMRVSGEGLGKLAGE